MLRSVFFLLISAVQSIFFWLYANLGLFKADFNLSILFKTPNASHAAILLLLTAFSVAIAVICLTDLFSPNRFPNVAAKVLALAVPAGAAVISYLLISEHSRSLLTGLLGNPSGLSNSETIEKLLPPLNALAFVFSAMIVMFTTNLVAIFYQDREAEQGLAANYVLLRLILLSVVATAFGFLLTLTDSGGPHFKYYFFILCLMYLLAVLAIPVVRMNLVSAASNVWAKAWGITVPAWLTSFIEPLKNAGWLDGLIKFIGN